MRSEEGEGRFYIAQITSLWEGKDGECMFSGRWFYQQHEIDESVVPKRNNPCCHHCLSVNGTFHFLWRQLHALLALGGDIRETEREIFISEDYDDNPVHSITGKCVVKHDQEIGTTISRNS